MKALMMSCFFCSMAPLLNVAMAAVTLALPGPTNTLLAVSGSISGFRASCKLISAVLAGYALAIGCIAILATQLSNLAGIFAVAPRALAAAVLLVGALRLWRTDASYKHVGGHGYPVSWSQAFLKTLLNPKALVLSAILLPQNIKSLLLAALFGILASLIVASALAWIAVGTGVRLTLPNSFPAGRIARLGAAVLVIFALAFAWSAIALVAF